MLMNMRAICFLLSIISLLMLSTASTAKTIYVDDDAAGLNNGTSWIDAYTYLQEALNDAKFADKPVEIRVAQGTYRPNGDLMAIPEFNWRTTTFQLINGVTLRGGYAGLGAPDPNVRDIEQYETILSGDLNANDDPNLVNNSENSYHVVTGSGTDETAVLDGFTITTGNANALILNEDPNDLSRSCGGGMFNASGSPTLKNCEFRANSAYWNGGAMYNVYGSNPILIGCVFAGNLANSSSGIGNGWDSNPKVTNCTFTGNRSMLSGGGVIWSWDASSILINCILWNNTSPQIVGDAVVTYSDIQGGWEGEGNIDIDPLFVEPGHWSDVNDPNAIWIDGDSHLKSQAGRWDPASESWVVDDVTSPCIDTGDPNSPVAFEPFPNGGIINMGAYGGTDQASKSPSSIHAKYGGGTGEPNHPYLIYTPEQMNTIGLHSEDRDSHFKLMADIDLGGLGSREFNMIGTFPSYFRGVFDGNGHTISNFTYISTDIPGVALFSTVEGSQAEIRDLGLIDPVVDAGIVNPIFEEDRIEGNRAGSLVDFLWSGTIRRCYVQGGYISADLQVGGLVAYNQWGAITDCCSTSDVNGIKDIGGLIGYNGGIVTGCHAISTVTGVRTVGGLVGGNDGTIQESDAMGDVTGDRNVGGLVGENIRNRTIQRSFSTGFVTGIHYVGGLVGYSYGDVADCYSMCSISGGWIVGGLIGFLDGLVTNCYSAGTVVHKPIEDFEGEPRIHGLVGSVREDPNVVVLRSFWDIETSGRTVSFGGTGLTTVEMQKAGTFLEASWDFVDETENGTDDIWWIREGQNYPRLWWELSN